MKKRKDGRFALQKRINGKRVTFYGKTEPECYKSYLEYEQTAGKPKTFGYYADLWEREHRDEVGTTTWQSYLPRLHDLEHLYSIPVKEITASDIQGIIKRMHAQHYSKSTMSKLKCVTSMILDTAIINNERITNFTPSLAIPRSAPKKKRKSLTEDELRTVNESYNDDFGLYAYFLLWTGLRRGELLALQWKDIDLKRKTVSVTKAVTYTSNQPEIKPPKTESGERTVPLPDCLVEKLQPKNKEWYVFGGDKPLTKIMVRRRWENYCRTHGIDIDQHQLRHTYATILKQKHISPKDAQQMLGHADLRTTMEIYTHFTDDAVENVRNALNG